MKRMLALALCAALMMSGCKAPGKELPVSTPAVTPAPTEETLAAPTASPAPTAAPAATPAPTPLVTPSPEDALPEVTAPPMRDFVLPEAAEQRWYFAETGSIQICPHGAEEGLCPTCHETGVPLPDLMRLATSLSLLTEAPRPMGSAHESDCADFLTDALTELGYNVISQPVTPQTVGYGRPGTNSLSYALGTAKLGAVAGSKEGQLTAEVLFYDPDEPLPASVEGKILILEKSTSFLSLMRGLGLGTPAAIVLKDVPEAAAKTVAEQWPEQIVTLYEEGPLPRSGDEATVTSAGNGDYDSENLIAVYGAGKGNALYFCAHYDSAPLSPGACDNGAGVAVLLELARLTAELAPEREVRFLFLTGEEDGLFGATVYAKNMANEEKAAVKALYNLDMFADAAQGTPILYTCDGQDNAATALLYSALFAQGLEMPAFGKEDRSDHAVFDGLGIPAAMFAQSESDELYHTPYDTAEKLSVSYMDQVALWCMATIG